MAKVREGEGRRVPPCGAACAGGSSAWVPPSRGGARAAAGRTPRFSKPRHSFRLMSSPADPATIQPHLLLGSRLVAEQRALLDEFGVTHVLNTASEIPDYHLDEVEPGSPSVACGLQICSRKLRYLHLDLNDDADDDIAAVFARCVEFIEAARSSSGKCFVHCQAGISRSATIVIAYLMRTAKLSLREAFLLVKERRCNIGPNQHFMRALVRYEDELRSPEQRGAPPSFTMEEYYTSTLEAMGFEPGAAAAAVRRAEGRFELALNYCLAATS